MHRPASITRRGRALTAGLALAALSVTALTGASAQASAGELAKRLRKLDPGALLGGNSIVGTRPGHQLHGVHGRPNFIAALGDGETIHGASRNDQLGAIGEGARIVPSKQGHSLIVAGPRSRIVVSGKGHNLIYSHAAGATIVLDSPGNEVIANGPHDRIVCADHASHELIEITRGVRVAKACTGHHNTIEAAHPLSADASGASAHASQTGVTGSGTNEDPYVSQCNGPEPAVVGCTVSFPARSLTGLWAGELVPAYQCPPDQPVLIYVSYASWGLPHGVEVLGLGPIGVYIPSTLRSEGYHFGTRTGDAVATNWTKGTASYTVVLHCTRDILASYPRWG
jgi:hypothetical protein